LGKLYNRYAEKLDKKIEVSSSSLAFHVLDLIIVKILMLSNINVIRTK